MNKSDQINELASALSKAQGKITGALKDSSNPFFKSKYADLASCWDAAREHLSANGLAIVQLASANDTGVTVETMLTHSSGQWISESLTLTPKEDTPQAVGSCLTYARRYGLASIVGIAQVDDDGNAASAKSDKDDSGRPSGWRKQDTSKAREYADRINKALVDSGEDRALEIWNEIKVDHDFATAVFQLLPNPVKNTLRAVRGAA